MIFCNDLMSQNQQVNEKDGFTSLNQSLLIFRHSFSKSSPFQQVPSQHQNKLLQISARLENQCNSSKQSVQAGLHESSKEQLSDQLIHKLEESLEDQEKFMQEIGKLKTSLIQEQVISHITNKSKKFEKLNFRTVQQYTKQRIQKMIKIKRKKKNWNEEDVKILVWIVAKYCEWKRIKDVYYGIDENDWNFISSVIPGTKGQMCMFKWLSLKKSKIRDQKWQKEEQQLLESLVLKHGDEQWSLIAEKLFFQNPFKIYRCNKQCKQHWNCFLNPAIKKGNWSTEEDIRLISMILKEGEKRWAKLVKEFPGRTENALKNRYSILLQKQMKRIKLPKKTLEKTYLENYIQRIYTQAEVVKEQESQIIFSPMSSLKEQKIIISEQHEQKAKKKVEGAKKNFQEKEISFQMETKLVNEEEVKNLVKTNKKLVPVSGQAQLMSVLNSCH